MFNRVKRKDHENGFDIEIDQGRFRIRFAQYYYIVQWIADAVIGCFFIAGSVMNLLGTPPPYSNIAYLIGSLAMIVRPVIRVIRHISIRRPQDEEEEEENDASEEKSNKPFSG